MKLRCWGSRGSVPVSGPQHWRYGGDTACLEIRSKNDAILVLDAGTGLRSLGLALEREGRRDLTLLFSHCHWDHIQGLGFFKPLYDPAAELRLGGCAGSCSELLPALGKAFAPPLFPVSFQAMPAQVRTVGFEAGSLCVDSLRVTRIPLSHPAKGAGFRVEEDGRSLVYLTDNELSQRHEGGCSFEEYAAFCQGADLLIHDAEYTPGEYAQRQGWGHSHWLDAARLARAAGVGLLGLFHHNQERTDQGLDELLADCRRELSRPGDPACAALSPGWTLDLGG